MAFKGYRADAEQWIDLINWFAWSERDTEITTAALRGETSKSLAARFDVSYGRVRQIVEANLARATKTATGWGGKHYLAGNMTPLDPSSIEAYALPVRAENALRKLGLKKDSDVREFWEVNGLKGFLDADNVGCKTVTEIIAAFGLRARKPRYEIRENAEIVSCAGNAAESTEPTSPATLHDIIGERIEWDELELQIDATVNDIENDQDERDRLELDEDDEFGDVSVIGVIVVANGEAGIIWKNTPKDVTDADYVQDVLADAQAAYEKAYEAAFITGNKVIDPELLAQLFGHEPKPKP